MIQHATKITLVPTAGLCNRMNAILCGCYVNSKFHYPIDVYWEKTNDCCALFSDLFQPIAVPEIKILPLIKWYLKPATKRNLFFPKMLRVFKFDRDYDGSLPQVYSKHIEQLVNGKKDVYVTSYNRFCIIDHDMNNVATIFKPQTDIESIITQVSSQFSSYTVGVHVRRTDNIHAINNNPIEKYISLMDHEVEMHPDVIFYVASDSNEVKQFLRERYEGKGCRVIICEWTLQRNSLQGMKDAVAELYILGKANKIIGSTHSTYSTMAARLYGKEIVI